MYILSIDQGTSSTKTLIVDESGKMVAKGSEPLKTYFGEGGIVEQDPEALYDNVLRSIAKCIEAFKSRLLNKVCQG